VTTTSSILETSAVEHGHLVEPRIGIVRCLECRDAASEYYPHAVCPECAEEWRQRDLDHWRWNEARSLCVQIGWTYGGIDLVEATPAAALDAARDKGWAEHVVFVTHGQTFVGPDWWFEHVGDEGGSYDPRTGKKYRIKRKVQS
jgi:hypothetical protein